jgi:hypothetical protein
MKKVIVESEGIDSPTSRMLSERSSELRPPELHSDE